MTVSAKHVGDGSADDAICRMSMAQFRPGLVSSGLLSETEYTAGMAALDDPTVIDTLSANVAAWGRRPTGLTAESVAFGRPESDPGR